MARNDYGLLREEQQKALDAANFQREQPQQPAQEISATDPEPTRPEGHYGQSPGWTAAGGMEQQQASALAWVKAGQERQGARDERDEHIERQEAGDAPEKTPDTPAPAQAAEQNAPTDAPRTLKFFEDHDRSGEKTDKEQERAGAEQSPSKEQGGTRTLNFFEDRNNGQERDR